MRLAESHGACVVGEVEGVCGVVSNQGLWLDRGTYTLEGLMQLRSE
jgi:hypothetical protein